MIKNRINRLYYKLFGHQRSQYKRMRNHFPPDFQNRTLAFYLILKYIEDNNIEGDIIECGVGRGVSLFTIGNILNLLSSEKKLYGFDSFQGFPKPTIEDNSFRNPKEGEWSNTSMDHVAEHFSSADHYSSDRLEEYYLNNVKLIPGFFEKTLPKFSIGNISFLHLDCDLYESYRTCTNNLFHSLASGSIIMYDEYNHSKWPGATKAIDESLIKFPRFLFYSNINKRYLSIDYDTSNSQGFMDLHDQLQLQKIES